MLKGSVCGKVSSFWGIVCVLCLAPSTLWAQPSWAWAKRAGTGTHQRGLAITSDSAGNTYSTGIIRAANNTFDANLVSALGGDDVFLAKYDVYGNNIWVAGAGGPNDDQGNAIARDNAGNLYVTGFFRGNITFYGSPNITLNGSGNDHAFIAKYSPSGAVLWARQGISNDAEGNGITTDGVNVYVTGEFASSLQFSPLSSLSSAGNEDVFIASFNAATGAPNWCISGGGTGRDIGHAITMDAGGVYVTGMFNNTITFQNMSGSMASVGSSDMFLVKYNLNGTGIWKKRCGSSGADEGKGIVVRNNAVYTSGWFSSAFNIYDNAALVYTQSSAVSTDAFLLRCNAANGNYVWIRSESGSNDDEAYALAINPQGDLLMTGMFKGTLGFGPQPSVTAWDEDVFVTAYDSLGNFLYGAVGTGGNKEKGYGITAPGNTIAFVTGSFDSSPAYFGVHTVNTYANDDIFFAELGCIVSQAEVGPNQQICSSSTTLSGNSPLIGSGQWSLLSGTGTITTPSSPTSGVTAMSPGLNVFVWTITNQTCVSRDTLSVLVDAVPTPANAGSNQQICASTATLAGNTPVTGTGTWSVSIGTGVLSNAAQPNSGVSNLSVGVNEFIWTITNQTCPASRDTVRINVDQVPSTAVTAPDQTLCSSVSTLNANTPVVGTGMWTLVTGTGTIVSNTSAVSSVTGLTPGANVFQWTITNGVCPSSTDQITLNVDAMPTPAIAGSDQTICSSSATLTGNTPVTGTGLWTRVSGTGIITSPSSATTGISAMTPGMNVFEWTISNGTCPSSADTVIINVDAMPTPANAGNDDTHCVTSDTLAGNTAVTGSGWWTLVSGTGTITNPTAPNAAITGLSPGQNVFEWTISNGVCPSSSDQVIITVDASPTPAVAGADQTICSSAATLTGNVPSTGTGMWSLISGSGILANPSGASSGVTSMFTPVNVFEWRISNGTCPSSADTVVVQVDTMPTTANAGMDNTLCSSADTLTGNIPLVGTGQWSLVSGTGTIANAGAAVTGVSGLSVGPNTFQWMISNGVCPSSYDTVMITVDAVPTVAVAGADQTLCSPNTTLAGNTPLTGTGMWTLLAGNGTIANASSATSAITGMTAPLNLLEWRISNGTCPSSADSVLILIDAMPTAAAAGNDNTLCNSSDVLSGNVPLTGTGQWTLISGTGIISNPNAASTTVSGLSVGQNIFQWTISNGVCPASDDQVIITVDANPTTASAGSDLQTCSSSGTLSGNVPVTGSGTWTVIAGGASVLTPNTPVSGVNDFTTGFNLFEWSITNGTCPASRDTVSIEYNEAPSAAVAGPDILVCSYDVVMQAQTPSVGTGVWEPLQGSLSIADSTNPSAVLNDLPDGTYLYTWTTQNGFCISDPDTVMIQIFSPPTQAWAGNDKLIHITYTQLEATPPDTGIGSWSVIQGSAVFEDANDPDTRVTNLAPGINVLRWTTSNGVCAVSEDEVTIQVNALVIPSGFSPNGDNVNDQFVIIGLEEYPDASLEVFNRWGGVVYKTNRYDNSWNGTGENSQPLPEDIYYYVLEVNAEVFTGFVAIKRSVQ